ncbi:MAG TPA: hydantoinase/oxoprolinase family protein [Jatrophihabitans sp.]|jgi:N-methylhydantoinase A/oxoprolinase/acetone carboxylase beta subunit
MNAVRIGIDVGGTNTDAVVMDSNGSVLAWQKVATTPGRLDGITEALTAVLTGVEGQLVNQVMVGTTHPADALRSPQHLGRVGVLRIGAPATLSVPPFTRWPAALVEPVAGPVAVIGGGHEHDGREINPLDVDAVREFARSCEGAVDSIAVIGVTSPVNTDHERRAAAIIRDHLGDEVAITQGHEISGIGLLERENSAILNGSLITLHRTMIDGLFRILAERGLSPDLYLTQNDGTLMSAGQAARRPVLMIGSGPTNSMRGAAHLSGLKDAIVVDVGGTSTDVGLLVDGFPRISALPVEIGGVRTNYRMPDLISAGFGADSSPQPGPANVAKRLTALADRIKASRGELPLVAVGGGAHLVPDRIDGVSEVLRPESVQVANAIGAATAEASGVVDQIFVYDNSTRESCLAYARERAEEEAVLAGADPARVRITKLIEVPLTYMAGSSARVLVQAQGPLPARM